MKKITNSEKDTKLLGAEFAKDLKSGDILLLYGDLGAGKTSFTQGLAKGLGARERILSPTFVLQRTHDVSYKEIKTLNHIDLYRVEKPTEIEKLELLEIMENRNSLTVIEWADRIKDFYPKQGYKIFFKYLDENKREIKLEKI